MTTPACPDLSLAVIGNCQIAVLVDAQARIVWLCLPRPDGDPVFSALLTGELGAAESGVFAAEIARFVRSEQRYEPNTPILETLLYDDAGSVVRITDYAPRFRSRGRMFRPMMFVRMVEPIAGRPLVTFRFRPTSGYGERLAAATAGSHHLSFNEGGTSYRLTTDASISALIQQQAVVLDTPLTFVLGPDEPVAESPASLGLSLRQETRQYWQDWVRTLALPFDWQDAVIRAAITLKLCTFEDSGAVLAALTTSIPESAHSGRNWDYRYCWLRDGYFVIQALNRLGATRTMEGYLHFIDQIVTRSSGAPLQPLYSISGDGDLPERTLHTLPGFREMGPVRVGNEAATQTQNDVHGSVILAVTQLFFDRRLARPGDVELYRQLETLGERCAALYDSPDAGPWERRGILQPHTFSAAISWAGCERLARIAMHLGLADSADRWRRSAAEMRQSILSRAWHVRRQAFVATLGGDALDASTLLLADIGLLPAADVRFQTTVEAIGRELRVGDLLFRYRHADDFGLPRSAFTVCSFWYVNALASIGRIDEAREQFGQLLTRRSALGLLSEDIDPATGVQWGNFPQTYSHVGIINSAIRLSRSWDEAL